MNRIVARKLAMIEAVIQLDTLRVPPPNRLEKFKGERVEQYSIRVNDQMAHLFRVAWRRRL